MPNPIPDYIKDILDRYVESGSAVLTGGTRPLVENRLVQAALQLEDGSYLPGIASYIWNELPLDAWGSPEKVMAWSAKLRGDLERYAGHPKRLVLERDQYDRLGRDTWVLSRVALVDEPDGEGGTYERQVFMECLGIFPSEKIGARCMGAIEAMEKQPR
jgi:hypothetical protein